VTTLRILLVDPHDVPDCGTWSCERWDRIFDLGRSGSQAYERWEKHFGCPVLPVDSIRAGLAEFRRVRAFMQSGIGRLVDREGLDWWELMAIMLHDKIDLVGILRRLADSVEPGSEIYATRGGFCPAAISIIRGVPVRLFPQSSPSHLGHLERYWRIARKFPLSQLLEIVGDKYDPIYSARRVFASRRRRSSRSVVLLPSAYVNVTRLGLSYASMLPEQEFLLVTTRRSGRQCARPSNVVAAELASYVENGKSTKDEYRDLAQRWQDMIPQLESDPDTGVLIHMGHFQSFPARLREGLVLRDAWRSVLESERVSAVLCGDDSNPTTHIPLLLAARRKIPNVVSHHGALDGRHLIKKNHADVVLAKGKMEEDYLVRVCGVLQKDVEVGAPPLPARTISSDVGPASENKPLIVYFSESYEVMAGRTEQFYRDVLPSMANLSIKTDRRLVVKLHPAESERERTKLVKKVLSAEQMRVTSLVSGALTETLLDRTWFGVTVLSTAAVDCAKRGIPCFFCKWLEYWPYGYIDQFERFGVGRILRNASEIDSIPAIVGKQSVPATLLRDLWDPISPERLRTHLGIDPSGRVPGAMVAKTSTLAR